ncbi:MAG: ribosome-associated translation inhibitor RaiA [Candidatus Aminicenantes bacterium]|nr:ribosome-associated translation inhibitor RaiA [Candidatus Aminicenantes bacterium]
MNVNYTARQTNITPDLKKYCQRRLKSLEKFIGNVSEVDIILAKEKYRHKAEINIKVRRSRLNVVEETHDIYNSLSLAFDNLEKRVKKEKGKSRRLKRRKGKEKEAFAFSVTPEEEKRFIRSQDFSLKPMTLDEAVIQFELNKREVFVFRKTGSEKWAVIYRRADGNVGLVEPE